MKTSELIDLLATGTVPDKAAYNLLVGDMFDVIPEADIASPAGQALIRYSEYKITAVLLPVIGRLAV